MERPFNVASNEAIAAGEVTDAYFLRTEETLEHAGRNPEVVAEVTADQFPDGMYEVLAGVDELANLLADLSVDVAALPEGSLFDGGPVARIRGSYRTFARYETAILGVLSQASAFATKALAARVVAGDRSLLSFGSRHLHPALAPVVERSAMIGGFDGYSNVAAEAVLDQPASGTMPHALMLLFGEDHLEDAWRSFDAAVEADVPRIALCDTFFDERVESLAAARALDGALEGVRLDTTGSRRGDFAHIVREVRWELDRAGFEEVDIFLSGGIGLEAIEATAPYADGYGVGSFITDASPVDFALDIVEVERASVSKRGKLSGVKHIVDTPAGTREIRPGDEPIGDDEQDLFEPIVEQGEVVYEPEVAAAAERAQREAGRFGFEPFDHA